MTGPGPLCEAPVRGPPASNKAMGLRSASFSLTDHFGLCLVQRPRVSASPCSCTGLRPQRLPQVPPPPPPAPPAPAGSAAGREAPAAGDTCPWALAKPHGRAGQGSALLGNLAEWTGGWRGGVGTAWGLGDSHSPRPWSPLPPCRVLGGRGGSPTPAVPSPGQPSLFSII